ncbi:S1C family serine protease [Rhodopirellula baltica]|nr:serine protease [Rhodopirellula baltica]
MAEVKRVSDPVTVPHAVQQAGFFVPRSVVVGTAVVLLSLAAGGMAWWFNASLRRNAEVVPIEKTLTTNDDPANVGEHAESETAAEPQSPLESKVDRAGFASSGSKIVSENGPAERESLEPEKVVVKQEAPTELLDREAATNPVTLSRDQDKVPDRSEVLSRLRSVTVFMRVRTSQGMQTGSGFLFRKDRHSGIVVTNAHVVKVEGSMSPNVNCVFNSGMKDEISLRGYVLGKDESNDLAFIKINQIGLPDPLDLSVNATIQETATVLAAGYPFGEALKTARSNPAITITQGSVSSIRRDDDGKIMLIQVDAGINSGNSGGPLVDERGRLVGVAVAKVAGTNIGFAIPKRILDGSILGRANGLSFERKSLILDQDYWKFNVTLTDPVANIESGKVILYRPQNEFDKLRNAEGDWLIATENVIKEGTLRRGRTGLKVEFHLPPSQESIKCQVRLDVGPDRLPVWTQPIEISRSSVKGAVHSLPGTGREFGPMTEFVREVDETVELPAMMKDFAVNPKTGDIACAGFTTNSAFLVSAEQTGEHSEKTTPKETSLSGKPMRILYKEYDGKAYFLVGCEGSSDVHFLDAETFSLVDTIHCECRQVRTLFSSANSEDPFIYYDGWNLGVPFVGAIDLRDMLDRGSLLDHVKPIAVSSGGERLYLQSDDRRPLLETRSLLGNPSDTKPALTQRTLTFPLATGDHHFVCAPTDRFVINGNRVLSPNLHAQLAKLEFDSFGCFRRRPIIAGLTEQEDNENIARQLRIASSNSFDSIGKTFQLSRELSIRHQRQTGDQPAQNELPPTGYQTKVLIDDRSEAVVLAVGNRLARIPLERFELPEEDFLELNRYSADFIVGQEKEIEIGLAEGKTYVKMPRILEGMKRATGGIRWKPNEKQVGRHSFPVEITRNEKINRFQLEFNVRNPHFLVPVEISGFAVDPGLRYILCWSKFTAGNGGVLQPQTKLAVIPYRSRREPMTTEIDFEVQDVTIVGEYVAMIPRARNPKEIRFYDAASLKPIRKLALKAPVREMRVTEDHLQLILDGAVNSYNIDTLDPIDSVAITETNIRPKPVFTGYSSVCRDGILDSGMLYNTDCSETKLLVGSGTILCLKGVSPKMLPGSFLRRLPKRIEIRGRVLPTRIPDTNLFASVESRVSHENTSNSKKYQKYTVSLNLIDGERNQRASIPITIEEKDVRWNAREVTCHFAGDEFLVGVGQRIYRWSPAVFLYDIQVIGIRRPTDRGELHFIPRQSAFVASQPETLLEHTVVGGVPPYTLSLADDLSGLSFDRISGDVTLSLSEVVASSIPMLREMLQGVDEDDWLEWFETKSNEVADEFHTRTGTGLEGYPVAVPVRLAAADSTGKQCEMQYFVIADVPPEKFIAHLKSDE